MHSVTKTFEWAMAHRLIHGYQGKCKNIHGHTYKCEITVRGPIDPKQYGMVLDFGEISQGIKQWVNDNLDHAMMVDSKDSQMIEFLKDNNQKMFILPDHFVNTTAENIGCLIANQYEARQRFLRQIGGKGETILQEVKVWETPTSCATWGRS